MAIPSTTGQNFGFEHRLDEIVGGYNVLTVQTGRGAAANLLATFDPPTPYWRDSRTLLITESALFQPTEKFALQPAFVARWQKPGDPGVGFGEWYSIGARPQYNFNKYLGIAFEAGLDYVGDPKNEYAGWLRKYTIAPLITNGYGFFARPQIRAFFTYAEWSNALKGRIGGDVYKNRTSGISAGVQFEAWW
jgi:maltoporin